MEELEKRFIYGSIKQLNEQVSWLSEMLESQVELTGKLVGIIEKMQSVDYTKKQNDKVATLDMIEKIRFMKNLVDKNTKKS